MNACVYPCDCPIHDQVAEMLGIVSTTGKDFRPASSKTAQDHALDARRHADEARRQYEIARQAQRQLNAIPLKAAERRRLEKELKGLQERIAEKAHSFGYDTATVGYHRSQASETHGAAFCPSCHDAQRGTIIGAIGASVEASCGDCGETWYYDDRF